MFKNLHWAHQVEMITKLKYQTLLHSMEQLICPGLVALDQMIGELLQLNAEILETQGLVLIVAGMEHQVVKMVQVVDRKDFYQLFLKLELHYKTVALVD